MLTSVSNLCGYQVLARTTLLLPYDKKAANKQPIVFYTSSAALTSVYGQTKRCQVSPDAPVCVCRYYISKGAIVDQLGGDLNSTPLHWATR